MRCEGEQHKSENFNRNKSNKQLTIRVKNHIIGRDKILNHRNS